MLSKEELQVFESKHKVEKADKLFGLFKVDTLKIVGKKLIEITDKDTEEITGYYTELLISNLDGTKNFIVTGSEAYYHLLKVFADYGFGFDIDAKSKCKIVSYVAI